MYAPHAFQSWHVKEVRGQLQPLSAFIHGGRNPHTKWKGGQVGPDSQSGYSSEKNTPTLLLEVKPKLSSPWPITLLTKLLEINSVIIFEVFMMVTVQIMVSWVMTPCSLVSGHNISEEHTISTPLWVWEMCKLDKPEILFRHNTSGYATWRGWPLYPAQQHKHPGEENQ